MGTRKLGERSWLLADDDRESDLALKAELLSSKFEEVFAASEDALAASRELLSMVKRMAPLSGVAPGGHKQSVHPLQQAAQLVQEDLCLLQLRDDTWHLDAACLCFPSRWRLADKIGRPLVAVHDPVRGYDPVLADRVNAVFDHLLDRPDDRPVWRRNWFIHPNPDRFQPQSPVGGDPVVVGDDVLDKLWVRSERQVLRRVLAPNWAVFSIRIQQASLRELFAVSGRRERVVGYLSGVSVANAAHHGVSKQQREELLQALGHDLEN